MLPLVKLMGQFVKTISKRSVTITIQELITQCEIIGDTAILSECKFRSWRRFGYDWRV